MDCSRASIQFDRNLSLSWPSSEAAGTGLDGLKDVHRMGLVEGLHHIDAKSIVSAEEHGVVDEVFAKSEHAPLGVFHRSSPPQSSGP